MSGKQVQVGQLTWPEIRNELTTGEQEIDIVGISGPLDFDTTTGQPEGAIEVWKPSNQAADCPDGAPCFDTLETIQPD